MLYHSYDVLICVTICFDVFRCVTVTMCYASLAQLRWVSGRRRSCWVQTWRVTCAICLRRSGRTGAAPTGTAPTGPAPRGRAQGRGEPRGNSPSATARCQWGYSRNMYARNITFLFIFSKIKKSSVKWSSEGKTGYWLCIGGCEMWYVSHQLNGVLTRQCVSMWQLFQRTRAFNLTQMLDFWSRDSVRTTSVVWDWTSRALWPCRGRLLDSPPTPINASYRSAVHMLLTLIRLTRENRMSKLCKYWKCDAKSVDK